jgi:hypothetical protein
MGYKSSWIFATPLQSGRHQYLVLLRKCTQKTVGHPIDGSPWFTEVKLILWPRDTRSTREEIPEVVVTAVTVDAGSAKRPRPAESSLVKVSRRIQEETAWGSPEARLIFCVKRG